jgi:hypothetical protein
LRNDWLLLFNRFLKWITCSARVWGIDNKGEDVCFFMLHTFFSTVDSRYNEQLDISLVNNFWLFDGLFIIARVDLYIKEKKRHNIIVFCNWKWLCGSFWRTFHIKGDNELNGISVQTSITSGLNWVLRNYKNLVLLLNLSNSIICFNKLLLIFSHIIHVHR